MKDVVVNAGNRLLICFESLRQNVFNLSHDIQSVARGLNQGPSKYEAVILDKARNI